MTAAKRILAVDYGQRRTGLAATDFTGSIATPLPPLVGLADPDCAHRISELAKERDTEVIVVGLPLDSDERLGSQAKRTLAFVALLEKSSACPVHSVDESHTTDEAHSLLREAGLKTARRKKLQDSVAALLILERYRESGASQGR